MPLVSSIEPGEDTIRILVTTDNHVGYNENDPIRGDDSWKTFEEILSIAKDRDVDMILQSGDLFHINKPSKKSMYHVMRSLRMNCLGDKPCELELLSDPSSAIDDGFNNVNYEDPNINVSIPVFSISGNHDDATGEGLLSPLDILSVAGLVNHFGKVLENDKITISPLLFQKGSTKLALYGLANVRDERLYKTFRDQQVKFMKPKIRTNEWFNLMAVHQNHSAHTNTSYLPENFLPSFLDLIVWGHEHECIPNAVPNPETNFSTLQPGSSVVTSLCEGESVEKNVFVITIKQNDYALEPVKLKTVRPFVMQEISLSKSGIIPGPASRTDISRFLSEKIEDLIAKARDSFKESNPELFDSDDVVENSAEEDRLIPLPLVRLRVEYSGEYEVENPRRFSNRFVGKVANVNDVVQFYKKKEYNNNRIKAAKFKDVNATSSSQEESPEIQVHALITSFLQSTELSLLPEDGLNEAVKKFVQNEDRGSLKSYVETEMENEIELLMQFELDDNSDIHQVLTQIKKNSQLQSSLKKSEKVIKPKVTKSDEFVVYDDGDAPYNDIFQPATRKPTTRAKPASNPKTIRKQKTLSPKEDDETDVVIISDSEGEGKQEEEIISSEESDIGSNISDDSIIDIPEPPKRTRGASRGSSRAATASKASTRGRGRGRGSSTATSQRGARGRGKSTTSGSQSGGTQSNLHDLISGLARR